MVSYQNHRANLNRVDNNDTVSNSFIWFHSKNETIKSEVKLSFGIETMLISLSNWNLTDNILLSDKGIPTICRLEIDNQIVFLLFLHGNGSASVGTIQLHDFLLGGIKKFYRHIAFAQFRI